MKSQYAQQIKSATVRKHFNQLSYIMVKFDEKIEVPKPVLKMGSSFLGCRDDSDCPSSKPLCDVGGKSCMWGKEYKYQIFPFFIIICNYYT